MTQGKCGREHYPMLLYNWKFGTFWNRATLLAVHMAGTGLLFIAERSGTRFVSFLGFEVGRTAEQQLKIYEMSNEK